MRLGTMALAEDSFKSAERNAQEDKDDRLYRKCCYRWIAGIVAQQC